MGQSDRLMEKLIYYRTRRTLWTGSNINGNTKYEKECAAALEALQMLKMKSVASVVVQKMQIEILEETPVRAWGPKQLQ